MAVNAALCHFAEILPRISEVTRCNKPLLPSLVPFPRVKHECNRQSCLIDYGKGAVCEEISLIGLTVIWPYFDSEF
jgi:hypothetical protein